MDHFSGHRILAIFAHPDDESFLLAGTFAALTVRGAQVTLVHATRGECGEISDPSLATRETLGEVRELELRNAMANVGVTDVRFLGYRDSGMYETPDNEDPRAFVQQPLDRVAGQIAALLDEISPDLLITFGPEGVYLHPDHVYVHECVKQAFIATGRQRPPVYFVGVPRELFEPVGVGPGSPFEGTPLERFERMGTPLEELDITVDVNDYLQTKWAALCAHRTQYGPEGPLRFLNEEGRQTFIRYEHFSRAPFAAGSPAGDSDPLVTLAGQLRPAARVIGSSLAGNSRS